jgi:hypothetical protein
MSYIGNSPGVASQRVTTTLTATAGQTQFTTQSGYVLGYVDVYLNGAKLVNGSDFEAITGTYITLFAGAAVNDVIELVSYVPRGLSDGYTKAEADAKFLDVGGDTASGTINLGTNGLTVGTNQLVANGGFVGIGTASPTNKLTIQADATGVSFADNAIAQLLIEGLTDYTKRLGLGIDTTNNVGVIQAQKYGTGNYPLAINPAGGNVGIGTTSPSSALYVRRTSGNSGIYTDYNGTNIGRIEAASNGNLYIGITTGNGDIAIGNTANTSVINILSSGNVGVGTASPSGKFHVSQTSGSMYINVAGGIPRMYLGGGNGWGFNRITATEDIFFGEPGDTGTWRVRGSGTISLGVGNTATSMTIVGDGGNVGIGTSSPAYPLDILKTQDGSTIVQVTNASTGTSARTRLLFTGDASAGSLSAGMHNSAHASYPNQAWIWASGSTTPLVLGTQGTPRLTIDSSGSVGVGLTPSSQFSAGKAIEVGSAGNAFWSNGANDVRMSANVKYNLHAATGYASTYVQSAGVHTWNTSPSQAAGTAVAWNTGMTLSASGYLGIGTASPAGYLHSEGSAAINALLRNPLASGYTTLRLYNDINSAYRALEIDYNGSTYPGGELAWIGTTGAYPVVLATNNTERIRINGSGYFGIGTSNPITLLHAKATSAADVTYRLEPYTNAYASKLLISSQSSGDGGIQYGAGGGNDLNVFAYGNITFLNGTGSISGGIGTERVRIDSSGNVGINTTSPLTGGGGARWLTIAGNTGNSYSGGIAFSIGTTNQCWVYQDTDNYFSNQGAGSNAGFKWGFGATDYMRLNSTGLGVGTSSPSAKLEVRGATSDNIIAANAIFKATGSGGDGIAIGATNSSPWANWIQSGYLGNGYSPAFNSGYQLSLNPVGGIVTVGTTSTGDGGSKLVVNGAATFGIPGRFVHAWWQGVSQGTTYLHIRTSMWGGGATYGNRDYIMGGFRIMGYQYTTPGNCDQWIQFHNWSGSTNNGYNKSNAGNWDADNYAYVDSTGYVTLRLATPSNYTAYTVDLHQTAIYAVRTITVTAVIASNSTTI